MQHAELLKRQRTGVKSSIFKGIHFSPQKRSSVKEPFVFSFKNKHTVIIRGAIQREKDCVFTSNYITSPGEILCSLDKEDIKEIKGQIKHWVPTSSVIMVGHKEVRC